MTERERIRQVYEQRKQKIPAGLNSFFNRANLFIIQGREREILEAFKRSGIHSLETRRILDIGCGGGGELRNFIRYGASPENLFGIDLLPDRIGIAKKISPNIDFRCGDASEILCEDESFDMVLQFTVFTSILDKGMKRSIAAEMLRVLKPDGIVLWYDYHMNNPKNPDVKGVKKQEIYELFPHCLIDLKRITLAPPITRLLARHSWFACYLLERLKVFNTHYLGVIRKEGIREGGFRP